MSNALLKLIADCDPAGEIHRWSWRDVLIVRNLGAIEAGSSRDSLYASSRGFNMLLLDHRGRPMRYCKCRHSDHARLRHENSILTTLGKDPELRQIIPPTRAGQVADLQVQVSVFVPGASYQSMLPSLRPRQWKRSMQDIAGVAYHLSRRARTLIPTYSRSPSDISLALAAADSLSHLASCHIPPSHIAALLECLESTPALPRIPQHGDLWAGNVIWFRGSWWILDFEMFGDAQVPMYDVYHLVRTSLRLRDWRNAHISWPDRMAVSGAASRCARETLRSAMRHFTLTPQQAIGALIFYSIHIAATFHASGRPKSVWKPLLLDVHRMAEHLQQESPLEDYFLGGA